MLQQKERGSRLGENFTAKTWVIVPGILPRKHFHSITNTVEDIGIEKPDRPKCRLSSLYNDVFTAWDNIRDTLQETNREHIPKKLIIKHKLFCNKNSDRNEPSTPDVEKSFQENIYTGKYGGAKQDVAIVLECYKKCFPVKKMTCSLL